MVKLIYAYPSCLGILSLGITPLDIQVVGQQQQRLEQYLDLLLQGPPLYLTIDDERQRKAVLQLHLASPLSRTYEMQMGR